jgi:hypothetical protein
MRAEVADHGAQRSRNEHAEPVAEVRFGSKGEILAPSTYGPLCPRQRTQVGHRARAEKCQQRSSPNAGPKPWVGLATQSGHMH